MTWNRHIVSIGLGVILIVAIILAIGSYSPAMAHKVSTFAFKEGDTVYTESYLSDGIKVVNSLVEVFDTKGEKLLEGKTDKDGKFSFKAPKNTGMKIVLTASMGHRAVFTIPEEEIPKDAPLSKKDIAATDKRDASEVISGVTPEDIRVIVDDALEKRLEPVINSILESQRKGPSFTEILGGIGYIFGLMGIVMYFHAKYTNKDK